MPPKSIDVGRGRGAGAPPSGPLHDRFRRAEPASYPTADGPPSADGAAKRVPASQPAASSSLKNAEPLAASSKSSMGDDTGRRLLFGRSISVGSVKAIICDLSAIRRWPDEMFIAWLGIAMDPMDPSMSQTAATSTTDRGWAADKTGTATGDAAPRKRGVGGDDDDEVTRWDGGGVFARRMAAHVRLLIPRTSLQATEAAVPR
eukprot:TRINITY_DN156_c0_g1_i1.p1 TRINITY_DN156_c0_g1~~TRINITY_DN156_c0_g1_i1.p1  ORF type:complete len:203 (+),score=34.41 TRINITY_DN156_c0_g1_i1:283-891(+)